MINGHWDTDEETADEFRARVVDAIEGLIDAHAGERIVVVCHGGVINSYLCHVLGLTEARGLLLPQLHEHQSSGRGPSDGIRSVVTINETSHLRGTGLPIGLFQGAS